MTRRVNKFDIKMPSPMPASKRPSSRVDLETRLRKIDQEFQQDQEFVPSSSSTFMISNLKQELSHIKQDVEKLMMDDDFEQKPFKVETSSGLKQELFHQKEVEEQLKKEIRELRTRAAEGKTRDDRTGYLTKEIEVLKRQQDILFKEKEEALQTVAKLRRELSDSRVPEELKQQITQLKRKSQRQRQQKQEFQRTKKWLQSQNSRLSLQLSGKVREKEQFEGTSSEWKQERYRMESEISRLKLSLTNAQNNPEWKEESVRFENEISKLKMQVATAANNPEWKEEKGRMEAEIAKWKGVSTSTGDQWKEEKLRLENEISRLQVEGKRNKELLDSKYKSNKEEMVSSINSIKDLTEKNYQFVRKINNMESDLTERSNELRKKEETVMQQKEEIKTITKEKDTRYNNLMSEFKKLEETLNKSAQENLVGMKNSIFSLENSLRAEQGEKEKLRGTIAELSQKVERLSFNLSEEKRVNQELGEKLKQEARSYQEKEIKSQKRMSVRVDELQSEISTSKKSISERQILLSTYSTQIKELQNYKANQEQLKIIQLRNLESSMGISQLETQVTQLKLTIQSLQVELLQKAKVIQKLSQTTQQSSHGTEILKVESKYKEIIQELNHTIDENQMTILRLQNQISELSEASKKVKVSPTKNTSFDDIFKQHIRENQQLKLSLKNKCQEIFALKNVIEDYKRKIDYQRNQSQIQKLKAISDEKKIKSHYEIEIQNITSEGESQKRKFEALKVRLDAKVDELKKKDEFIQNVIISKIGKDAYNSELEYITKEVGKFFSVNYGDKLVVAEEEIRMLKERVRSP